VNRVAPNPIMPLTFPALIPACAAALLLTVPGIAADGLGPFFGIHVVDGQTGRGVPLVELETVHHLRS
jgi:hypothetical protein